jgi:hypothetical protein
VFPLLQLAGAVARPHTTDDRGHRRLALQGFRQLVGVIPNDGVLVEEDALTTLLLRARAARWPNAGRSPRFVGRDATVVGRLAGDPGLRIYALPEAHAYLQMRGFEMGDVKAPGLSGLAEVRRIGGCAGPDARWRELPDLQRSPRMALVAIDAGTDATAIVYVGAHERPAPLALDWPRVMLRGFEPRTYELSKDDERARFMGDTKSDGLTEPPSLASFAFVTRLSLRHIPGAPIVLPVGFGLRPGVVAARLAAGDHGSLSLCPAFPGTPPSIAVP